MSLTERDCVVLKRCHVTEKSYDKYVFEVDKTATKSQIAKAVENMYNVTVEKVTTLLVKGKRVRAGRRLAKRRDWKKAYVMLKDGDSIQELES